MLFFLNPPADDLLDAESLPSTDKTELNYRTRPLSPSQELRLVVQMLCLYPIVLALGITLSAVTTRSTIIVYGFYGIAIGLCIWIAVRQLMGVLSWLSMLLLAGLCFAIWGEAILFFTAWGGASTWDVVLVGTWFVAVLMTRQVASWILVGPTVDVDRMDAWKRNIPGHEFRIGSRTCPELWEFWCSLPLLAVVVAASRWLTQQSVYGTWLWPITVLASTAAISHILSLTNSLFVATPPLTERLRWTWKCFLVFLTYDSYQTPAAGVFRFPDRFLRPPTVRWALITTVMLSIACAYLAYCPAPGGLPNAFEILMLNTLATVLVGPIVLLSILWLTSGGLLARFDRELGHHRDGTTTDWDIYVSRMRSSNDELEQKHTFVGTTQVGDYPVLVDDEVSDQHVHMLGDSGGNKTSMGIAPQSYQRIARGESSVVVIDLKGDPALFHSCRTAAERHGRRFRWLSNRVGTSTFGFNPFQQSHNRFMTVEQLGQQLLQGLSLDHGLEYGAGYYTAMNETVLNTVMHELQATSFRELSEKLSDRYWYESIGGNNEDWREARHLAALVKRLASSSLLNFDADMACDQDVIQKHAIDVTNVLQEPQVVYLNLSSSIEPTNAPAIARLFLWTMFTAASHVQEELNRTYFYIDEFQQIASDGIALIFEQFRGIGGTIIAAHQTTNQLARDGANLVDTVDSCTAMKQIFRASDLTSLERIHKLSGTRTERTTTWEQAYQHSVGGLLGRFNPLLAKEGSVRISDEERPRHDWNALLKNNSQREASLVRFTFGSGYTQFAGNTVPIVSQYHICAETYKVWSALETPTAKGAFTVDHSPTTRAQDTTKPMKVAAEPIVPSGEAESGFVSDFIERSS